MFADRLMYEIEQGNVAEAAGDTVDETIESMTKTAVISWL